MDCFSTNGPKLSSVSTGDNSDMIYEGTFDGVPVLGELDSSSSHAFMSEQAARDCGLETTPLITTVILIDQSSLQATGSCHAPFQIANHACIIRIYTIYMHEKLHNLPYLVIRRSWLDQVNPRVDWKTHCIHLKRLDGRRWTTHSLKLRQRKKSVVFKKISVKKLAKFAKQDGNGLFAVGVHPKVKHMNVNENFNNIVSDYKEMFVEDLPDNLPLHRALHFEINLKSDEPPLFVRLSGYRQRSSRSLRYKYSRF